MLIQRSKTPDHIKTPTLPEQIIYTSDMNKLCPECFTIGKEKPPYSFADRFTLGIAFLVLPIIGLFIIASLGMFSWYYDILLTIIFVILGITNLYGYYKGFGTCPECGCEEMMPIKSPQAQVIIEENNLTVPENMLK